MQYNIVILAGGKATRMGDLCKNIPKSLFSIGGKSLLQRQLEWAKWRNAKQVVVAGSYMAERLAPFCAVYGIDLNTDEGMGGTGWAAYRAMQRLSDPYLPTLVMNGDVLTDMPVEMFLSAYDEPFEKYINYHLILSRMVDDISTFGSIHTMYNFEDGNSIVSEFKEKTGVVERGRINAGIYLLTTMPFEWEVKDFDETKTLSIERQVFPMFAKQDALFTFTMPSKYNWSDCGTPERVEEASKWVK